MEPTELFRQVGVDELHERRELLLRIRDHQQVIVIRKENAQNDPKARVALRASHRAFDRQVHFRGRTHQEPTLNRPARDLDELAREQAT